MTGKGNARRVLVGIIDSGIRRDEQRDLSIVAAKRFVLADDGAILSEPVESDRLGHGTAIARIILDDNPQVDLVIAQVFTQKRQCSSRQVAAALDWLAAAGVAVVNMSFGIRQPDSGLRLACERVHAAGTILVCAAPARGGPAFPAAYPLSIAVAGDARCAGDEISWLGTAAIDFGAHPFSFQGNSRSGGASYAAARITGRAARMLAGGCAAQALRDTLRMQCRYHGPERKRDEETVSAGPATVIDLHP